MRDIHESIRIISELLGEVEENDDIEIKQTNHLKRILFNLKIQGVDLPAIKPIAKELQDVIDRLHDSTYSLVTHKRKILIEEWDNIKLYIKGDESN